MTALLPLYRLTVYAPYSVDPTETTVLTPIGGAAHSDPFVVTSALGIAGSKPYLDLPRGKQASLDPITKKVTTGRLTVRLGDARVTSGGSNLVRWVTAFFGDTGGKQRLLRCRVTLEEALDGNAAHLATFFTGRLYSLSLDQDPQWVALELRDIRQELNQRRLFTTPPDASVSYAQLPSALPPGGVQDWGQFPAVLGLKGSTSILATYTGPKGGTISTGRVTVDTSLAEGSPMRRVITKDIIGLARVGTAQADAAKVAARVTLTIVGGATGTFRVSPATQGSDGSPAVDWSAWNADRSGQTNNTHGLLNSILLESLDPSESGYLAFPANGTAVRFTIGTMHPADQRSPLLVNTVHPVQFWKDILDGKFAAPNSDLTLRPLCAYDTTAFANLIADLTIPAMQFYIDAVADNAIEWLETSILQPRNLGYRFDPTGKLIPLDMRRTKDTASGIPTLVDDDLVTDQQPAWAISRDSAVTAVEFTYYVDNQVSVQNLVNTGDYFPDIGPIQLDTTPALVVLAADLTTLTDVGEKVIKIDSKGDRVYGPVLNGGAFTDIDPDTKQPTALSTVLQIEGVLRDYMATFASAAAKVSLRCRRTATPSGTYAGMRRLLAISKLPDTLTNQRGGTRMMLCVSRTEDGPYLNIDFVDEGSSTVAAVPTISSAAVPADDPQAIDVQVTVNAAADPVHLWYARADAGTAVAPAVGSPLWLFFGLRTTSGLIRVRPLMKGTRVFLRAQSRSTGATPKLPSDWAFIGGVANTSFVDISAITAPSAVAVGSITGNRALVSWTNGDALKLTDVYLTTGGVPGTWTEAMRLQPPLPPGSTQLALTDLALSTGYAVGVRHRDAAGGVSTFATQTFTTTGTATTAKTPANPAIGGGPGTGGTGASPAPLSPVPRSGPRLSPGVAIVLYATDPSAYFEIQHAPDSAGAPNVGAATTVGNNVPGTESVFVHRVALDGALHWYRTRHVGYGDTASAWSDWVSGKPVVQPLDGPTKYATTPLNSQSRFRCKLRLTAGVTLVSGTPKTILWDVEDSNVGALHSLSSNTERITIPVGGDIGYWELQCCFDLLNNATAGQRTARIRWSNGSIIVAEKILTVTNEWEDDLRVTMPAVAVGDYFWVEMLQASGVNQTFNGGGQIGSFVAIHKW